MSLAHRAGGALRHALDVRAWPIRANSARLNGYILAVVLLDVAAIGTAAVTTSFSLSQLVLFGFACLCSVTMVEATRRAGENAGWTADIYGIWELPIAVLLPPLYALLVPIPHTVLIQLRVKHIPLHRRVFSAAMLGLSYGLASVAFHFVDQHAIGAIGSAAGRHAVWALAVAACGVLQWAANSPLLLPNEEQTCTDSVKTGLLMNELQNNLKDHKVLVFSQFTSLLAIRSLLLCGRA
jgi:hypothetical protein